jgi:molecular chaperone DnaK
MPARGFRLGIDFGTTHTVSTLMGPDGRGQPLMFDGSFLLPSAVFAETDGRLLVGRDAERSARLDPSRFEPNPKRRVDDGTVLLGNREYSIVDLVSAALRRAGDEAARVAGSMPAHVVLTHPANWAASRRSVLVEAARQAGLPPPALVPEPVAAAVYFTGVLQHRVAPGRVLVVYDLGGGTFDTTLLRSGMDGRWEVLAADGQPDLGGIDLDAAIVDHLRATLGQDDDRWGRLVRPDDDFTRKRNRMLWDDVRAAKEQLSRTSSAAVHVPMFDTDVYLTREEFERIARPYLEQTVDLTASTLQRAGVRADQIGGLFLVGGSSRIPLVSTLLHRRIGVAPTVVEQPELVVAQGSLLSVPPPASPAAPLPATPPAAGPPAPQAGMPVSGPPPEQSIPSTSAGPRRRQRRTGLVLTSLLAVVVLLGALIGIKIWQSGNDDPDTLTGDQPSSGADSPTKDAPAGADRQSATINKAVWYGVFKLKFETVTYDKDNSPQLSVSVLVQNLGDDNVSPYTGIPMTYTLAGATSTADASQSGAVQGGQSTRMTFDVHSLDVTGSIANGTFTVGGGDKAQAVVPVGKGNLVAYEPKVVLANKVVRFRNVVVKYKRCELRGGLFDYTGQVAKDHRGLLCLLDVQYTGTSGGGLYFGGLPGAEVQLGLPDGTEIGPRQGPNEALYGNPVHANVWAGFEIDTPVAGSRYELRIVYVLAGEKRTASSVHVTPITL